MNNKKEALRQRKEWRKLHRGRKCMWCGIEPATDVHEILRRSQAPAQWSDTCNYLFLCRDCHQSRFDVMPQARQLACKFMQDNEHFNLERFRIIGGRADMEDVLRWLKNF